MYGEWFKEHSVLHNSILTKLQDKGLACEEIVKYFLYDNMKEAEPDFCPLYKLNKKCHNLDNLNCYLCACPLFRFNDSQLKSWCSVNHKNSEQLTIGDMDICDCSDCSVPHSIHVIKNHINDNGSEWHNIMNKCNKE